MQWNRFLMTNQWKALKLMSFVAIALGSIAYTSTAEAKPYVRADFVPQGIPGATYGQWYVNLSSVKTISAGVYQYVSIFVFLEGEYQHSNNFIDSKKTLENVLIVNCNSPLTAKLKTTRIYKSGRLVSETPRDQVIRNSPSTPLEERNLFVCRLFDSASARPLRPGFYYIGSRYIQISTKGNRICYEGISRHGRLISSVVRDSSYLSLYRVQAFDSMDSKEGPRYLLSLKPDSLYFGDFLGISSYKYENQTRVNISRELQQCLNSSQPFEFSQDRSQFR